MKAIVTTSVIGHITSMGTAVATSSLGSSSCAGWYLQAHPSAELQLSSSEQQLSYRGTAA